MTKEILYGGAAGGGKSALGVLWLIECCQKYPGSRWLMGRAKLKTLKETTLNTFFELTNKLGISDQFKYNDKASIIKWHNGSEILLKDLFHYPSDPQFDGLGSLEICGAFIDECQQVVKKAWNIVLSRCRYKLKEFGIIPKILGSCNPSKGWNYIDFYKKWRDNSLLEKRKFIQALPTDNPHLPQSYLDALLSLDKDSIQRLYFGNWEYDDDPSALISADAIADYWFADHVPAQGKMYMTIDVARKGKDNTVFRIWHGWRCIHREHIDKGPLDDVVYRAVQLRKRYSIPLSNCIADEDGVGGGVVDFFYCKGFVNGSKPLYGENFTNLKNQCSYYMAQKIEAREVAEVYTDVDVKDRTSEEMEQVKQKDIDKDGKIALLPKDTVKQHIGRSPDEWDSIMMRYYFELSSGGVEFR